MALDVDPVVVDGLWYRHVPAGANPAKRPHPPGDSRWQRGHVIDAIYLADRPDGVWAEWYRHLAEAAVPPNVGLPRDLLCYRLQPVTVADLSDADRLGRVGLQQPRPGRQTWQLFQMCGEALYAAGWRGLIAPRAARPTTKVLVLFLPELELPTGLGVLGQTRIAEPPTPPTGMRT